MAGQARAPGGLSGVRKVAAVLGLAGALVGGLWLLQGLGIVHLRPILCFADCEPLQGPSATWVVIGALVFAAGSVSVWWAWTRRAD